MLCLFMESNLTIILINVYIFKFYKILIKTILGYISLDIFKVNNIYFKFINN